MKETEKLKVGESLPLEGVLDKLPYNSDGLIPAISQQHDTGEVLMMAWMNRAALEETLDKGRVCYWSRSRQKFWRKGESSYVLFEVNLWTKTPRLTIATGGAPSDWAKELWEVSSHEPFRAPRRYKEPGYWMAIHSIPSKIALDNLEDVDLDGLANRIADWIEKEYGSGRTAEARRIVTERLRDLEKHL